MSKAIFLIAFYALFLIGEIRCIYQFCTSDFEPEYKRELIYGIGMVTPVGFIVGYLNIHDNAK